VTAYRPRFVKQLDGSQFAGVNCTCAAGAMALDRDTLGKKTSTGAIIRNWTGDVVGGTRQQQVADAIKQAYHVTLDVQTPIPFVTAMGRLDKGEGMMLAGQSAATRGTKWSASETFGGNHQWYVNERRKTATGYEWLVYDPLADGRRPGIAQSPMWIPEHVCLDFARRLDVGGHELGYGHFFAVFTKDTEPHVILKFDGTPTIPFPDHCRGRKGSSDIARRIRPGPGTQYAPIQLLNVGQAFTAYQWANGSTVDGLMRWYGDESGTRWIAASGLTQRGGAS